MVPASTAWIGVLRGASRSAASCGRDLRFSWNPPLMASTSTWSNGMRRGGALMCPVVGMGTVGVAARLPLAAVSGDPTRADGGETGADGAGADAASIPDGNGGPNRYNPHETIIPAQKAKKTTVNENPRFAPRLTRSARA